MSHPNFDVPSGLAVAWSSRERSYLVLEGEGAIEARRVLTRHEDPVQIQTWINAAMAQQDAATPGEDARQANPAHGRKENGAGLGAFIGSLGGSVLGTVLIGSPAVGMLLSTAGGGYGGYYAAQDDRKKRGAIGGATGGLFGPLFAALGGWIGGMDSDAVPLKKSNPSIEEAILNNPNVGLDYDEALEMIKGGDIGIAAAWIACAGTNGQDDPQLQHLTDAAIQTLRRGEHGIEIESVMVTTARIPNPAVPTAPAGHTPGAPRLIAEIPQALRRPTAAPTAPERESNPHDGDDGKWWLAKGHCCEACALDKPCSGEEGCEIKTNPNHEQCGKKKKTTSNRRAAKK